MVARIGGLGGLPPSSVKGKGEVLGEGRENCSEQLSRPSPIRNTFILAIYCKTKGEEEYEKTHRYFCAGFCGICFL